MKTKTTMTSTNTKITVLSDIIQGARQLLSSNNKNLCLRTDETRRIILICLLFLHKENNIPTCQSISLKKVLMSLNIIESNVFNLSANDHCQSIELSGTLTKLSDISHYPECPDLINYALEVLEYDAEEYFNIKLSRGIRNSNKKKKGHGIYYTPIDVVSFVVSQCVDPIFTRTAKPSILDCSCGSGVFLFQSLLYLEDTLNPSHNLDISIEIFSSCIWGVDISPAAVDCCKAIFLQYYLEHYENATMRLEEIWNTINNSIVVGDAIELHKVLTQNDFPPHFDCIVGNPPYVTKGRNSNLFIPFVNNMLYYSSNFSYSALILPLSICYSQGSEFIKLRNNIQNDDATWIFMNYDRSPDSLFGDQVKTRNTILFRNNIKSRTNIFTTNLQRWTSENRNNLFTDYALCNISEMSISKYVPKISTAIEKAGFKCICSGFSNLSSIFKHDKSDYPLIISGTAYNWLYAYDHLPPSVDENKKPYKSSTTKIYHLPDRESRDFCIAILSNRIAYWYWTVVGDGFHFNASFLSDFKIGKDTFTKSQYIELCRLGGLYSEQIKKHPTVSYNARKKIVNYSHWEAMDIVRSIENIIIDALNLSDNFATHIEQWYFKQVHCNRNNEKR